MPSAHPAPTAVTTPTATAVAAELRLRWPEARARVHHGSVRWIDGPARLDVHAHLARRGLDRAQLDEAGIRLQRRLSRAVLAEVVLHTRECHGRADVAAPAELRHLAASELAELAVLELPAGAPVPLHPATPTSPQQRAAQARALTALQPTTRPVDPDRSSSWRPVLERLLTTARQIDPATLQPVSGRPEDPAPEDLTISPNRLDGPPPLTLRVPVAAWPQLELLAVTHPATSAGADTRRVQLHWTDGPAPTELAEQLRDHGWPRPFRSRLPWTPVRALSPTARAAAVIVYRHRHDEPYRDPAAGLAMMVRWRSASARELDRRARYVRDRLALIEDELRDLPLPLAGPLPRTLHPGATGGTGGTGEALWSAAASLLAITPRTSGRQPLDPMVERALLPVRLAEIYERIGPEALRLLGTAA